MLDPLGGDPEGRGQLAEVRADHRGGVVALVVEELLPLAHHAEEAVVDQGDVDLDLLLHRGGELGHRHLEAAVADDRPYLLVRTAHLGADRRRQAEPHRAHTAAGDQGVGAPVGVVLGLDHLVLTRHRAWRARSSS